MHHKLFQETTPVMIHNMEITKRLHELGLMTEHAMAKPEKSSDYMLLSFLYTGGHFKCPPV